MKNKKNSGLIGLLGSPDETLERGEQLVRLSDLDLIFIIRWNYQLNTCTKDLHYIDLLTL